MRLATLGLLCAFSAVPILSVPIEPDEDERIHYKPLQEDEFFDESQFVKRAASGNGAKFTDYFPDCSTDPSFASGTSKYADGSGVYLTSSCDNHLTTPAVKRFHCWTDLFVVQYQATYANWVNSGQIIDCYTTNSCSEMNINLNQSCTTDVTTWDNQFAGVLQAMIPSMIIKDLNAMPMMQYSHNFGGAAMTQICTSTSNSGTCTWTDKGCHAVWTAQRNYQVEGYLRRSCNMPRSGTNVPDSSQRSDGYYTVGMQDYSFQVPSSRIIGCAATCSDLQYPNPVPGNDSVVTITDPSALNG